MDAQITVEGVGAELTILKGTTIDVNGYHKLLVWKDGKLTMKGTAEEPIIFRVNPSEPDSNRPGVPDSLSEYWEGIYYYDDAASPDTFKYVITAKEISA